MWDLRYQFSGLDGNEVYPRTLANLYLDTPLVIVGRLEGRPPEAAVQIVGRSGAERRDIVFPLDWKTVRPGDAEIRRRWAWHRIYDLLGQHITDREPGALPEVQELSRRFHLPVPSAAELQRR
jgi:hypothetical protein